MYENKMLLNVEVEKILNPDARFENEDSIDDRDFVKDLKSVGKSFTFSAKTEEEKAKEEKDRINMEDFRKNVGYFGSMDHFY